MVKKVIAKCFIYLVLLFMYVPILVLIVYSFTTSSQIGQWNNVFTFELYASLFKNEDIMIAVGNTLIIAVVAAVVASSCATSAVGGWGVSCD